MCRRLCASQFFFLFSFVNILFWSFVCSRFSRVFETGKKNSISFHRHRVLVVRECNNHATVRHLRTLCDPKHDRQCQTWVTHIFLLIHFHAKHQEAKKKKKNKSRKYFSTIHHQQLAVYCYSKYLSGAGLRSIVYILIIDASRRLDDFTP